MIIDLDGRSEFVARLRIVPQIEVGRAKRVMRRHEIWISCDRQLQMLHRSLLILVLQKLVALFKLTPRLAGSFEIEFGDGAARRLKGTEIRILAVDREVIEIHLCRLDRVHLDGIAELSATRRRNAQILTSGIRTKNRY